MSGPTVVPFWFGIAVDHIVENCPLRTGSRERLTRSGHWRQGVDLVDPDGTDICGWCLRVWKARTR